MPKVLDPAAALWTGWHTFELTWKPGSTVTIEIRARRDDVLMMMGDYILASIDRDLFRDWFCHPREPFLRDDVIWSVDQRGTTWLAIGEHGPYIVPQDTIQHLTASL